MQLNNHPKDFHNLTTKITKTLPLCPLCQSDIILIENLTTTGSLRIPSIEFYCSCLNKVNYQNTKSAPLRCTIAISKYLSFLEQLNQSTSMPKCFTHPTQNSIMKCLGCNTDMCFDCYSYHHTFGVHPDQEYYAYGISDIICSKHSNSTCTYYCNNCARYICALCKDNCVKIGHKVDSLKDYWKILEKQIEQSAPKRFINAIIASKEEEMKAFINKQLHTIDVLKNYLEKIKGKIQDGYKKIKIANENLLMLYYIIFNNFSACRTTPKISILHNMEIIQLTQGNLINQNKMMNIDNEIEKLFSSLDKYGKKVLHCFNDMFIVKVINEEEQIQQHSPTSTQQQQQQQYVQEQQQHHMQMQNNIHNGIGMFHENCNCNNNNNKQVYMNYQYNATTYDKGQKEFNSGGNNNMLLGHKKERSALDNNNNNSNNYPQQPFQNNNNIDDIPPLCVNPTNNNSNINPSNIPIQKPHNQKKNKSNPSIPPSNINDITNNNNNNNKEQHSIIDQPLSNLYNPPYQSLNNQEPKLTDIEKPIPPLEKRNSNISISHPTKPSKDPEPYINPLLPSSHSQHNQQNTSQKLSDSALIQRPEEYYHNTESHRNTNTTNLKKRQITLSIPQTFQDKSPPSSNTHQDNTALTQQQQHPPQSSSLSSPLKHLHTLSINTKHENVFSTYTFNNTNYLIVSCTNRIIRIYNLSSFQCEKQISTSPYLVLSFSTSLLHNTANILYSIHDNSVKILNTFKLEISYIQFSEHTKLITVILPHPHEENFFFTASQDKTIKMWDTHKEKSLTTLYGHKSEVNVLCFYDSSYLLSGSNDTVIKMWDINNSKCIKELRGHTKGIIGLYKVDKKYIMSVGMDDSVRIWDIEKGNLFRMVMEKNTNFVTCEMLSEKGKCYMLIINELGIVTCYSFPSLGCSFKTNESVVQLNPPSRPIAKVKMMLSSDNKVLISMNDDNDIKIWEVQ